MLPPVEDCIDLRETYPDDHVNIEPNTDYSEWGMHTYSIRYRRAQTQPATFTTFPLGTWAVDKWGDRHQLRRYRLDDPILLWTEASPWAGDATLGFNGKLTTAIEKYMRWIAEGSLPPPGYAYELQNGRIKISQGHHRAVALYRSGIKEIDLWVDVLVNLSQSQQTA